MSDATPVTIPDPVPPPEPPPGIRPLAERRTERAEPTEPQIFPLWICDAGRLRLIHVHVSAS